MDELNIEYLSDYHIYLYGIYIYVLYIYITKNNPDNKEHYFSHNIYKHLNLHKYFKY